ncbi:class I SAM-dependent methyltransferase, partial [Streptomyces sp. NPDC003832]
MFSPEGPSLRELAVQALSSVERGYDLLAPKFDHTPFRTPDSVLDAVGAALERMGPFGTGLDLCCGTGAGVDVLTRVCRDRVTGVDFSAGMLRVARARTSGPQVSYVRADVRALPFAPAFDLVVSFGANVTASSSGAEPVVATVTRTCAAAPSRTGYTAA